MPVLEVTDLVVDLGGRRVLDQVDLVVEAGERVGLLGSSGSGKSVTARVVVGQPPRGARVSGRICVGGVEVAGLAIGRRPPAARVAMVFQDSSAALHPLVPVGRQVAAALRASGVAATNAPEAALKRLAAVGLPNPAALSRQFPAQLSGGQRQRACVAYAMATNSPLLLADEPTTALDTVSQAQVVQTLRRSTGPGRAGLSTGDIPADSPGPGLLLITHDLAVAASLCDRLVVLVDGKVVEQGSVTEVVARPAHPYTADLVAAAHGLALPPNTWSGSAGAS